jgi:hypothetical protein
MDTREKIITPERAAALAGQLRTKGSALKVVTGYFDVLVAEHVRRTAELAAVFGATDDTTTGPTGPVARVIREPVECSPCLLRECPIDHRCMPRVPAGRVAQAAIELMR